MSSEYNPLEHVSHDDLVAEVTRRGLGGPSAVRGAFNDPRVSCCGRDAADCDCVGGDERCACGRSHTRAEHGYEG